MAHIHLRFISTSVGGRKSNLNQKQYIVLILMENGQLQNQLFCRANNIVYIHVPQSLEIISMLIHPFFLIFLFSFSYFIYLLLLFFFFFFFFLAINYLSDFELQMPSFHIFSNT